MDFSSIYNPQKCLFCHINLTWYFRHIFPYIALNFKFLKIKNKSGQYTPTYSLLKILLSVVC